MAEALDPMDVHAQVLARLNSDERGFKQVTPQDRSKPPARIDRPTPKTRPEAVTKAATQMPLARKRPLEGEGPAPVGAAPRPPVGPPPKAARTAAEARPPMKRAKPSGVAAGGEHQVLAPAVKPAPKERPASWISEAPTSIWNDEAGPKREGRGASVPIGQGRARTSPGIGDGQDGAMPASSSQAGSSASRRSWQASKWAAKPQSTGSRDDAVDLEAPEDEPRSFKIGDQQTKPAPKVAAKFPGGIAAQMQRAKEKKQYLQPTAKAKPLGAPAKPPQPDVWAVNGGASEAGARPGRAAEGAASSQDEAAEAWEADGAGSADQAESSLLEFLKTAKLEKFADDFAGIGVESIDDLQYITDQDLETMGMNLIQRRKFQQSVGQAAVAPKVPSDESRSVQKSAPKAPSGESRPVQRSAPKALPAGARSVQKPAAKAMFTPSVASNRGGADAWGAEKTSSQRHWQQQRSPDAASGSPGKAVGAAGASAWSQDSSRKASAGAQAGQWKKNNWPSSGGGWNNKRW